jgi:hypothetical protein
VLCVVGCRVIEVDSRDIPSSSHFNFLLLPYSFPLNLQTHSPLLNSSNISPFSLSPSLSLSSSLSFSLSVTFCPLTSSLPFPPSLLLFFYFLSPSHPLFFPPLSPCFPFSFSLPSPSPVEIKGSYWELRLEDGSLQALPLKADYIGQCQ